MAAEVMIRHATPDDADAVAEVFLAARADALPDLAPIHTEAEIRAYLSRVVADPSNAVWVAERDGIVVGFLSLRDDWVDHLYLRPTWYRQAIGTALLDVAKAERPRGLRLYCFQCNHRARSFYEAKGFAVTRMTDGASNEEHEPDIEYTWSPHPSGRRGRDTQPRDA